MSNGIPWAPGVTGAPIGQATSKSSADYGQTDRFRSFAERYLIERASSFTKDKELEQGWETIQNAKKLYKMIIDTSSPVDSQLIIDASSPVDLQHRKDLMSHWYRKIPNAKP